VPEPGGRRRRHRRAARRAARRPRAAEPAPFRQRRHPRPLPRAMTDLSTLDLMGHAELVRTREATPLELLDAAIARIEAARGLKGLIGDLFERARRQAAGPLPGGPLASAPFLLKDLGAPLAGTPERMGSVALRDHVSDHSAVVVDRYLAAGLVIAGKTNTPE